MGTLREEIDIICPPHYLIHHVVRYFTVHRRDQTSGTFSLTVDMSKVGLPGKVQARHDVRMRYKISKGANLQGHIVLTWDSTTVLFRTLLARYLANAWRAGDHA